MNKTFKITFAVFFLLVAFLTYLEATEPEPVNWTPSYMPTDKIPLGSFVFFENWKNSHTDSLQQVSVPPYEFLLKEKEGTYFFLNNYVNFDDEELNNLLQWVEKGNTLFVSAQVIGSNLLDTLHLKRKTFIPGTDLKSNPTLNFANPELRRDSAFQFKNEFETAYFNKIDTAKTTVLGSVNFNKNSEKLGQVNFLKTAFGKGKIFLHITPQAFGNYFLLSDENYRYAENVLSYLAQEGPVYWDNYYKAGKSFYSSPLYIFLNNKALKWAYYFVIFGSLLFIIFEGKRRQRPIPVVKPQRNQSYDYTQTIAGLYLEQNRYKELALKKIDLFLEFIRTRYRISTDSVNEDFYEDLAARNGNSVEETRDLFHKIFGLQKQKQISKGDFLKLSEAINNFKTTKNGK